MSWEDLLPEQLQEDQLPCVLDWNYMVPRLLGVVAFILLCFYLAWLVWRAYYRDKQCRHCGRAFVDLSAVVDSADLLVASRSKDSLGAAARGTVDAFIERLAKNGFLSSKLITEAERDELLGHLAAVIAAGIVQDND